MGKAITPSFSAKVSRAEKHLVDLERAINTYIAARPYAVSTSIEGKKKVHRIQFTSDAANTDIPIIAADAIYNLRSSLDHLMGSLVTKQRRNSVMFPIFFQGVWEPSVPGEDCQRSKERKRWTSVTRTLSDDVLTTLKRLQPPDGRGNQDEFNVLRVINRLSNADRHSKLPIVAVGLQNMLVRWKMPDSKTTIGLAPSATFAFFDNNTEIPNIPYRAMNVEVEGIPTVAIRIAEEQGYIEIPKRISLAAHLIGEDIIPTLLPFIKPDME